MGVIIYSSNLNISPEMAYGVLECDIVVTELHAYDFVIKDFVIKKGIICAGPCIFSQRKGTHLFSSWRQSVGDYQ